MVKINTKEIDLKQCVINVFFYKEDNFFLKELLGKKFENKCPKEEKEAFCLISRKS